MVVTMGNEAYNVEERSDDTENGEYEVPGDVTLSQQASFATGESIYDTV